ncbi:hypothetical protein [Helicobacter saguini]|nr:hypothetical protein [Helicobacter saguini]
MIYLSKRILKFLDSIIANKDSNTQNLNTNYALRKLLGTKLI